MTVENSLKLTPAQFQRIKEASQTLNTIDLELQTQGK